MIEIKNTCDNCDHHTVCRFKSLYKKGCDDLDLFNWINDDATKAHCLKTSTHLSVDVRCEYFKPITRNVRGV